MFLSVSEHLKGYLRKKGLEPLRPFGHQLLRLARLPISSARRARAQLTLWSPEMGSLLTLGILTDPGWCRVDLSQQPNRT